MESYRVTFQSFASSLNIFWSGESYEVSAEARLLDTVGQGASTV